jgi:hypothetical protein
MASDQELGHANDLSSAESTAGEAAHLQRIQTFHKVARNLLQSWTFYAIQVLRELTLKSAPSFGSFNALRMLLDEYLFYVIQSRITHPLKRLHHPDVIVRRDGTDAGDSAVRLGRGPWVWGCRGRGCGGVSKMVVAAGRASLQHLWHATAARGGE